MTGGALLGLILISMGWLFFMAGLALNYHARLKRSGSQPLRPHVPVLPGVVGSLTVFFTVPWLTARGLEVPWPWLWIALPLFLDPYCVPGLLRLARK